jgi:hypothetical protein
MKNNGLVWALCCTVVINLTVPFLAAVRLPNGLIEITVRLLIGLKKLLTSHFYEEVTTSNVYHTRYGSSLLQTIGSQTSASFTVPRHYYSFLTWNSIHNSG